MPAAAGSVRNVSMQRLSRSALENSQVPSAIAFASSLSGACARAPAMTTGQAEQDDESCAGS